MKELSLYIHIPFCLKKCNYCSFFSVEAPPTERRRYLKNLLKEISLYQKIEEKIKSIYIGGGTPTIYSAKEIRDIIKQCRKNLKIKEDAEISIEANPVTLNAPKLYTLKEAGVNRLSLGIQSLSDRLLKILGRLHNRDTAIKSIEMVREIRFKSWNVDLIYGIPTQNLKEWKETIKTIVDFSPPHISTYSLILEKGTPLYGMVKRGILKETEDEGYEMYLWTIEYLKSVGYEHYEISNFSMPGYRCIHNLSYWENQPYLGIGNSASSFYHGWRFTRTNNIKRFIGFSERIRIDKETEQKETMMMGLRLIEGINKREFKKRFGRDVYEIFGKELYELLSLGLLKDTGNHIRLTQKGIFLGNHVFGKFV